MNQKRSEPATTDSIAITLMLPAAAVWSLARAIAREVRTVEVPATPALRAVHSADDPLDEFRLLTVGQVAELLSVSDQTVANLIDRGELEAEDLQGLTRQNTRVPLAALRAYQARNRKRTPVRLPVKRRRA
jgi:excisionase family DNA binding protein